VVRRWKPALPNAGEKARLVPRCRFTLGKEERTAGASREVAMGLHTPIETHRTPQPFGVEILDLRHFSSNHLRPLLERESHVWAQLMSWDYRASADMILRYVDSKILPGYAAVENGRVGGYAFFVYEGNKGVSGVRFPADATRMRARDVEPRWAAHTIEPLQRSPGVQRIEAQLLPHESGMLSPPFLDKGFEHFPRLF